jgi:putative ABC transport system permease protein
MKSLFGIDMTAIMLVLVVAFAASLGAVAAISLSNRIMFRMGLRNVRRRRAQTGLIVVGLMLATLIITAAFTTGDSLNYSITNATYDNLQRTDLAIHHFSISGQQAAAPGAEGYASEEIVPKLQAAYQNDRDIQGFIPALFETLPVMNPRTRLAEPIATFSGIDPTLADRYSGLQLKGGGRADLSQLTGNRVLIDQRTADKLDARVGDVLTTYVQGQPAQFEVAGIVKNQRLSGELNFGPVTHVPGIAVSLPTLQRLTGHDGQISDVDVVLRGNTRSSVTRSDAAASRLEQLDNSEQGRSVLGVDGLSFKVEKVKQDAVNTAELIGNLFTTMFLVLGLFSIAAGVMLIFTIFVMLAAERKTEMGIARAVGASRTNLVQAFLAEGMAYDLIAGVIGAAIGVAAAVWAIVGGTNLIMGDRFSTTAHISPRSLVISYTLGVVLTFITVVISALRISRLNIVAAVRGTDERARREHKQKTNWRWVAAGVPALIVPPLGLYWLLRKGFGLAWAWVLGPLGLILGALLIVAGKSSEQLFPFTLGMSLLPLAAALIATYYGAPSRIVWTAVGVYLAWFWLMPLDWHGRLFGHFESGGPEMEVLSGIMIVTALTLVIVFNARLLNGLIATGKAAGIKAYRTSIALALAAVAMAAAALLLGNSAGGLGQLLYLLVALLLFSALLTFAAVRFPWFAPALKMGVAYPLANRFRTGMTIAMFSLIIFALTTMSVINADMLKLWSTDDARGSWDVYVATSRNNPVPDLPAALRQAGPDGAALAGEISASGRLTPQQWYGAQEVRQTGITQQWTRYFVNAGDDAFFTANAAKLEDRAKGYTSDRAVYDAVRTQPNLAVVDFSPFQSGNMFSAFSWQAQGVTFKNHEFAPFTVEVRSPMTGKATALTVIGVLSSRIPAGLLTGFLTNAQTFASVYGPGEYTDMALRLAPGVDADRAAKTIKAALVTDGVQAYSIKKLIDDGTAMSVGEMRIFQVFMGLGLFVGIAGLGVIAFRSVVERRQQIGMLRAIGYQRGTVELSFLLESGFIAVMGIVSGVVGGAILCRNLLTSDYFGTSGVTFFIPWPEVAAFVAIALGFALLMTWWPSRQAGRVVIAEALRYE